MTKEKILEKYPELEYDQVLKAMEEYGKLQYNQALEDAADNAFADYTCLSHCLKEDLEIYVVRGSILQLKKK